jgi:hypothetical protein
MTTDQIISKELPDGCMAWDHRAWTRFHQQAQLDAINRFVDATETKARKTYDEFGSHYDEEFIRAVNEIKHQLNEQAKR